MHRNNGTSKVFRRAAAVALAVAIAALSAAESEARSRTGRNIAIGVGAAVVTGIIINEAARARDRSYYSSERHYRRCRDLWRECDRGERWACRRASDYC